MVQGDPWTVTRSCDDITTFSGSELCAVVYRSTAVCAFSATQLDHLALAAQSRNRCESITGVMVYDDRHFFQWLEGPVDSVDRVMHSIKNDSRHADIDILDRKMIDHRSFADWSMKLAMPARDLAWCHSGIVAPPRDVVEDLRHHPGQAATILLKMVPVSLDAASGESEMKEAVSETRLKRTTASLLKSVIISTVIPELVRQYAGRDATLRPSPLLPETEELADLLIQPDQRAAFEFITELRQGYGLLSPLYGTLFEPAARRLGDLWSEDICTELDVTLGLSRLQTAVRLIAAKGEQFIPMGIAQPLVLIVPEPGELHRLGAALDMSVLSKAGWKPQFEYPTDDNALQDIVSAQWFDVLDLSLSVAFRREHWLPRINKTISGARKASLNPALIVMVGGRVFVEEKGALATAGADLASKTAFNVDHLILQKIQFMRGEGDSAAVTDRSEGHRAGVQTSSQKACKKSGRTKKKSSVQSDAGRFQFDFEHQAGALNTLPV